MANRTPIMQSSWFGQSPYIVNKPQIVDEGTLPELVVTASAPQQIQEAVAAKQLQKAAQQQNAQQQAPTRRNKEVLTNPTRRLFGAGSPVPLSAPGLAPGEKPLMTRLKDWLGISSSEKELTSSKQTQSGNQVKQSQKTAPQQTAQQQVTLVAKPKVEQKKSTSTKSNKSNGISKLTDDQIASMIIARQGGFGDGAQRKASLGDRYAAVQALINQRLGSSKNPIATVEREAPIVITADVPNVVDPTSTEIAQASTTPNLRDPRYLAIPGIMPYNDIPGFVAAHNAMVAEEPTPSEEELFFNGNLYSGTPAIPFLENPESEEVYTYPTAKKTPKEVKKEQKENSKEERKKRREENREKRRRLKRTASRKPIKKDKNKDKDKDKD